MIPELGLFALILALAWSILLGSLPLIGVALNRRALIATAVPLSLIYSVTVCVAFGILVYSFAVNDFSVLYIAENSHRDLPFIYRLCAVWGAHEGSLLLWIVLLACWIMLVAWRSHVLPPEFRARVLAVMGLINLGFLWFLLQTSNPFLRLLPHFPVNGEDLNPLLQDPGFVSHPPILYAGYVGFSVAFAFAVSALLSRKVDMRWVSWVRPWTLAAWSFLTLGIVLGSWWAYRELGWGGWWFWDPVENASLMPWLVGTALIHSLIVTEKRGLFSGWTVWLAICTFALSLLGTFLVRSGVLISVHAFAVDSARGIFILRYLALVIGAALFLYALRAKQLVSNTIIKVNSRETLILFNNLFLSVAAVSVLLGTLYPLLLAALTGETISVGMPYFNTVFAPLMALLMIAMGIGPLMKWKITDPAHVKPVLIRNGIISILLMMVGFFIFSEHPVWPVLGVMLLSAWVILSALTVLWKLIKTPHSSTAYKLSRLGLFFSHTGFAITASGAVLATFLHQSALLQVAPGEVANLGGYSFYFETINTAKGPNYDSDIATVIIRDKNNAIIKTLYPEKRYYPVRKMALSKVGLSVNLWRDIYVALGDAIPGTNRFAIRFYLKPAVRWLWYGGLMMLLGGLLAIAGIITVNNVAPRLVRGVQ